MELTAIEGRVLACLIEKEATVPDSYPLTLNSLRLACNQTSNRNPIVAYDDRAVEDTLLALKSKGLVRFVHAGAGARTTRYGHKADERWRLDPLEQAALAVLLLRGPQTTAEVRTRAERLCPNETGDAEAALDTLAARTPNPFAVRLARVPGERETRWAQVLAEGGPVVEGGTVPTDGPAEPGDVPTTWALDPEAASSDVDGLATRVAAVEDRLDALDGDTAATSVDVVDGGERDRPPPADAAGLAAIEGRLAAIEAQLARIESVLGDLL